MKPREGARHIVEELPPFAKAQIPPKLPILTVGFWQRRYRRAYAPLAMGLMSPGRAGFLLGFLGALPLS
jgi:hypothetical protein